MPVAIEYLTCSAEELPLNDRSIDTVVTSWTLCSVPGALRAPQDARRVLKLGGALLFVERGLAPNAGVQRWQRRLDRMWRRMAGGCNLDRRIDRLIREAGFAVARLANEYLKGPRPFAHTYCGQARVA